MKRNEMNKQSPSPVTRVSDDEAIVTIARAFLRASLLALRRALERPSRGCVTRRDDTDDVSVSLRRDVDVITFTPDRKNKNPRVGGCD